MRSTDKQIKHLTELTDKVNHIIDIWSECGVEKININWYYERKKGMNANDASIKISAFHSLIKGINTKRVLLVLTQF